MKSFKKGLLAILAIVLIAGMSFATLTNFPNGISSFGVPVLGGGNIVTTGTFYFVDGDGGSNSNSGLDADNPLDTLKYALESKVASSEGDVVILMPGHREIMTVVATISAHDVRIVGIGPTPGSVFFSSATFGQPNFFDVNGNGIVFENISVSAEATAESQSALFDVDGQGFVLRNSIINLSGLDNREGVDIASMMHDSIVQGNTFVNPSSAESCVLFGGARNKIIDNTFDLSATSWGLAIEQQSTAEANIGTVIARNSFLGGGSADCFVASFTATPGNIIVGNNLVFNAAGTEAAFGIDTDLDYMFIENYSGQADGSLVLIDPSDD